MKVSGLAEKHTQQYHLVTLSNIILFITSTKFGTFHLYTLYLHPYLQ